MVKKYTVEQIDWIKENMKNETKISGIVKAIQPYGAFITLKKGIDALLPIKNISTIRIKTPEDILKKGDTVDVKITEYDESTERITVSHKEFLGSWEDNIKKFDVGNKYNGIVRGTTRGGVFIELMSNLVGLAEHKSGLSYGEKVEVLIKKISPENHKIKLVILD